MLHAPKRWATLVAVGPISIGAGVLGYLVAIAGLPAAELVLLAMLLNLLAVPLVLIGLWFDVPVVESEAGVELRRWGWLLAGLFFAPLVGTFYLARRRKWFTPS